MMGILGMVQGPWSRILNGVGLTEPEGNIAQLYTGRRVRIVEANGCMGHVHENLREGVVVNLAHKKLYDGGFNRYLYATIRLDNGNMVERPGEARFWTIHMGLPEYQE